MLFFVNKIYKLYNKNIKNSFGNNDSEIDWNLLLHLFKADYISTV